MLNVKKLDYNVFPDSLEGGLGEPALDLALSLDKRLSLVQRVLQQTHSPASDVTRIRMYDARDHLRCLSNVCGLEVRGRVEDPKVASWLIDCGEKEQTLSALVMNGLPFCSHLLDSEYIVLH